MMGEAINKGIFRGLSVGTDNVLVSHLQYADDAIFFGSWSRGNACNLMAILKCFEKVSGLRVNLNKSRVFGVGVTSTEVDDMATIMGCRVGSIPFSYLGLPIGSDLRSKKNWFLSLTNSRIGLRIGRLE